MFTKNQNHGTFGTMTKITLKITKLFTLDFYELVVDEAKGLINYNTHLIVLNLGL